MLRSVGIGLNIESAARIGDVASWRRQRKLPSIRHQNSTVFGRVWSLSFAENLDRERILVGDLEIDTLEVAGSSPIVPTILSPLFMRVKRTFGSSV